MSFPWRFMPRMSSTCARTLLDRVPLVVAAEVGQLAVELKEGNIQIPQAISNRISKSASSCPPHISLHVVGQGQQSM